MDCDTEIYPISHDKFSFYKKEYPNYNYNDNDESDIDILIVIHHDNHELESIIDNIVVDFILEKEEVISPHVMTEEHFIVYYLMFLSFCNIILGLLFSCENKFFTKLSLVDLRVHIFLLLIYFYVFIFIALFSMFFAAFTSLLWCVLQDGHVHWRMSSVRLLF